MPNRILKESICSSDTVDLLSAEEERLFTRLITKCDDFGCFDARPAILRAECFPLKVDQISLEQMATWTGRLTQVGLIEVYQVAGRPYLRMVTWLKHQQKRANNPKYPLPAAGERVAIDAVCKRLLATDNGSSQIPSYSYPVSGNVFENENDPERTKASTQAAETTAAKPDALASAAPHGAHSPLDLLANVKSQLEKPDAAPTKVVGDAFAIVFGVKTNYGLIAKLLHEYDAPFELVRLMIQIAPRWNQADDPHRYLAGALRNKRTTNGRSEPHYLNDAEADERRKEDLAWTNKVLGRSASPPPATSAS